METPRDRVKAVKISAETPYKNKVPVSHLHKHYKSRSERSARLSKNSHLARINKTRRVKIGLAETRAPPPLARSARYPKLHTDIRHCLHPEIKPIRHPLLDELIDIVLTDNQCSPRPPTDSTYDQTARIKLSEYIYSNLQQTSAPQSITVINAYNKPIVSYSLSPEGTPPSNVLDDVTLTANTAPRVLNYIIPENIKILSDDPMITLLEPSNPVVPANYLVRTSLLHTERIASVLESASPSSQQSDPTPSDTAEPLVVPLPCKEDSVDLPIKRECLHQYKIHLFQPPTHPDSDIFITNVVPCHNPNKRKRKKKKKNTLVRNAVGTGCRETIPRGSTQPLFPV